MGKKWKQWQILFSWATKSLWTVTAATKRCLLLGRKAIHSIKSRNITLPTNVHLVKAIVFPVVMYGYESWTIKKAECRRIDAFKLWYWRRLLRVPWTARRSNQSILKEINPGISLEGMMLKLNSSTLATSCEELTQKRLWCREGLGAGGEGTTEDEMAGWHHWLDGRESEWIPGDGDGQGSLACCDSWGHNESDTTERLNWTELRCLYGIILLFLRSNRCWQFDLWFLCLFEHLEFQGSCTVEAWLGEFWALLC